MRRLLCLFLVLCGSAAPAELRAECPTVAVEASRLAQGPLRLADSWRFQAGDATPNLSESDAGGDWRVSPTSLSPGSRPAAGDGSGWFRVCLRFDETSLSGRRLALLFSQSSGASEIYLDGVLLESLGHIGASQETTFETRERRVVWLPTTGSDSDHVLTVRYVSHRLQEIHGVRHTAGFSAALAAPEDAVGFVEVPRRLYTEQAVFTAVPLAFGFLHLLLFLFDRRARENLWLAVVTLSLAAIAFCEFREEMPISIEGLLDLKLGMSFAVFLLTIGTIGFLDALAQKRRRRRAAEFLVLGALIVGAPGLISLFGSGVFFGVSILVFSALVFELIASTVRFLRRPDTGAWILGVGLCCLFLGLLGDFAIDAGFVKSVLGTDNPYLIGAMVLILSMSIYLARSMTRTRRQLEDRLEQVRDLSERNLAQEKAAREQEIAQRLLEVDNARKTSEIGEARELQLSLLPQELPRAPGFELAAWILTATEVGGDFYDARIDEDGSLVVAVGDAAGHGIRAGLLAAGTKGLFGVLAGGGSAAEMLTAFRRAIDGMQLRRLHMSLTLARFHEKSCEIASAGMPPAMLFRAQSGVLEELTVNGLPLGARIGVVKDQTVTRELSPGDVVLISSDGFPELRRGETEDQEALEEGLGYDGAAAMFQKVMQRAPATRSAQRILAELETEIREQVDGQAPEDDVTLLVVRAL